MKNLKQIAILKASALNAEKERIERHNYNKKEVGVDLSKMSAVMNLINNANVKFNCIDEDDQIRIIFDDILDEYMVVTIDGHVHANNISRLSETQVEVYIERVRYTQEVENNKLKF